MTIDFYATMLQRVVNQINVQNLDEIELDHILSLIDFTDKILTVKMNECLKKKISILEKNANS